MKCISLRQQNVTKQQQLYEVLNTTHDVTKIVIQIINKKSHKKMS